MQDKHVDQAIGAFCKAVQNEINQLPALSPDMKQKAAGWLDECAKKATQGGDKLTSFNKGMQDVQTKLRHVAGASLPKDSLTPGKVNAFAFSGGNDLVFGFSPSDARTMAHELTHVVQQRKA